MSRAWLSFTPPVGPKDPRTPVTTSSAHGALRLGLAVVLLGSAAVAQASWIAKPAPRHARDRSGSMTYDESRQRTVLVSGYGQTWEWDGAAWSDRQAGLSFSQLGQPHFTAYDDARQCVVLVGRSLGAELWEWDGVRWTKRNPPVKPPLPNPIAYDSARQRLVMFGNQQTWEWDGSAWTRLQPAQSPIEVVPGAHRMAYDPVRQRVVLYGFGTWEWDGAAWTRRMPSTAPPVLGYHAMAWDPSRQRIVVACGLARTPRSETWEWDGTNWAQSATMPYPPGRMFASMSYDTRRQRMVLFGKSDRQGVPVLGELPVFDTWERVGTKWGRVDDIPLRREGHAMAYDSVRQRTVLFGGHESNTRPFTVFGDTWEWNGRIWTPRAPARTPRAREGHAMAFDAARQNVLMFGGAGVGTSLTWLWDGTNWSRPNPPLEPRGRTGHAMAYDEARRQVVLFGGASPGPLADTWLWSGSAWTQASPLRSPLARSGHTLVYHAARQTVVLFGGKTAAGDVDDTWEWDGTTWTPRPAPRRPTPRADHAMVYEPSSQNVLMFGGDIGPVQRHYLWRWDGSTWSQGPRVISPSMRHEHAMVYDQLRQCVLLAGGSQTASALDTWLYGDDPAAVTPRGAGCAGGTGVPELVAFGQPVVGNGSFAFDIANTRPSSAAAVVLSLGTATLKLPAACSLLVDPLQIFASAAVPTNADGFATVPFAIPVNYSFPGFSFSVQGAVVDPPGFGSLALTRALDLVLGI